MPKCPFAQDTARSPATEQAREPAGTADAAADELVTAVLTASRVLVSASARSLAAAGETLTLPQFRTRVVLESRGPMNISRLGEHLDVIPSTAMRTVDRLVTAGMPERTPTPATAGRSSSPLPTGEAPPSGRRPSAAAPRSPTS